MPETSSLAVEPNAATAGPALSVDRMALSIGAHQILTDVTFEVPQKAVTTLVGPSGSGKSSLLRVLNRMWDHAPRARVSGSVRFGGFDIYDRRVDTNWLRTRIGMVFQRPSPFPRSVYDNIALPLKVHGTARRQIAVRVEEALVQAALWDEVKDRLHAPALTLSGGQQQRLCIARALAVAPDVLLMDEPASALDPRAREHIDHLIQDLAQRVTIVMVTHHLEEARSVGSMTGVLLDGRLELFAPTPEVFKNPPVGPIRDYLVGNRTDG